MVEVVILVPGVMGSELFDGGERIWPASPLELFLPYKHMDQLMKPDLRVGDVIRSVSISAQYADLIDSLGSCGFKEEAGGGSLYVMPYDWRKDNAKTAEQLADLIDRLHASFAAQGGVEIDLVAHSMGGLVSRHYLESGRFAARPGFRSVKRLITLGTPQRGSPLALSGALARERHLFLSGEQVRQLGQDSRYPALYQLFPPRGEPFVWNQDRDARFAPIDIYDPAIAGQLGLSTDCLALADAFHRTLDLAKRPGHVAYFFFVGSQQETITEMRVTLRAGAAPRVTDRRREDGGDGTVPLWSSLQSPIQTAPVSGEHGTIYKSRDLLQVMAGLLGKQGVLAAELAPPPQLFLRERVVETGADTRAVLSLPTPAAMVSGELRIVRMVDSDGKALVPPVAVGKPLRIAYEGTPIDRLSIQLAAPDFAGAYRVEFVPLGEAGASAADELLVQRPAP